MNDMRQDPRIPFGQDNVSANEFQNTELSMVHLKKDEAKSFDLIQNPEGDGEPFIDEDLQIRSYAPLGERLKNDIEFRNIYLGIIKEYEQDSSDQTLKHFYDVGKDLVEELPFMPAPGDDNPEIKKLAKAGHGGDSIIALLPQNMIDMLNIERGEEYINKITGLQEFGGKFGKELARPFKSNIAKSIVRVGATVAGAVYGGPLGAMAGSAIGSGLTGRKPQDWLPVAAKSGAYTWGAQALAPHIPGFAQMGNMMASSGIPGLAQMGNTMGNWASPGATPGWGHITSYTSPSGQNLMNTLPGSGATPGWGHITSYTSPSGQNLMNTLPGSGGSPQQSGLLSNLLGNNSQGNTGSFASSLLPLALQAGSGILAYQGDKENYKNWQQKDAEFKRKEQEKEDRARERAGLNYKPNPDSHKRRRNPYYGDPGEPMFVYEDDERRQEFKQGGRTEIVPKIWGTDAREKIANQEFVKSGALLKGPGDGRSDSIYTEVPQDTFVVNAFTVSMIGNGDSSSGAQRIQEWLDAVEKKYSEQEIQYFKRIMQNKPRVPVAFSAGEVPILPYHILMIGDVDLEKGHELLEAFQKNVKKHKSGHKGVLPPPTKNLSFYLKV